MIKNRLSGFYLTIENANMDPKSRVIVWHRTGETNQQWYIDPVAGTLRSKLNDSCLDVEYGTVEKIVCNPCQPTNANQEWIFDGQHIQNRVYQEKVFDVLGELIPGNAIYNFWQSILNMCV